jgi:hypothetical protein
MRITDTSSKKTTRDRSLMGGSATATREVFLKRNTSFDFDKQRGNRGNA